MDLHVLGTYPYVNVRMRVYVVRPQCKSLFRLCTL